MSDSNHSPDDESVEDDLNCATFLASLPPIQGAIKRDGGGNGMRIQLDIPEEELPNALRMQLWTGKVLHVQIEALNPNETSTPKRSRVRRRVVESDSGV